MEGVEMEQMYRLKKEAIQFMKEDLSIHTQPSSWWDAHGVSVAAIEPVESVYVEWSGSRGAIGGKIESVGFVVRFMGKTESNYFNSDLRIRNIMDEIQKQLNAMRDDGALK
jgi:hypothetical protein